MKYLYLIIAALVALTAPANAALWSSPPGAAATTLYDTDTVLVNQAGTSRTANVGQFRATAGAATGHYEIGQAGFSNLSTAKVSLAGARATVVVTRDVAANNLHIPATMQLQFINGAKVLQASGTALYFPTGYDNTQWPKVQVTTGKMLGLSEAHTGWWNGATAGQMAVDAVIDNGGLVVVGKGSLTLDPTQIVTNTSGKKIAIKGAGIGATVIHASGSGGIFDVTGYLVEISDMSLVGGGAGSGIKFNKVAGNVAGRISAKRVQASGFTYGIEAENFDNLWLEENNCGSNVKGIYIHPSTVGSALVTLARNMTNNNSSHGVHVTTTSIIGHVEIESPESVGNGGNGVRLDASTNYGILSVRLNNVDIEGVTGAGNVALYLNHVFKYSINGGQYSALSGNTIFASIQLDACGDGVLLHPWFRGVGDGIGAVTHNIYVSTSTRKSYLFASNYFGTQVGFDTDGTADSSQLFVMDALMSNVQDRAFTTPAFTGTTQFIGTTAATPGKTTITDDGNFAPRMHMYKYTGVGSNYYETLIGNSLTVAGAIDFKTGSGSTGANQGSDALTTRVSVMRDGRVLMGPTLPTDDTKSALQVNGAIKLGPDSSACTVGNRGAIRYVAAAGGAPDTFEACSKSAADAYAWRPIYTAP